MAIGRRHSKLAIACALTMGVALVQGGTALAAASCGAPVITGTTAVVTCSYVDANQTWTVPTGVDSVALTAEGAAGGSNEISVAGGDGGKASGTLAVTAGEVLTIVTGGVGGNESGYQGASGGFGGGGAGGSAPSGLGNSGGAGGGGGSFVFDNSGATIRPDLAAGGGGGAGANGCIGDTPGVGGGSSGTNADPDCPTGDPGGGGQQNAVGAAGGDGATSGGGAVSWDQNTQQPNLYSGGTGGAYLTSGGGGGGGGFNQGGGGGDQGGGGGSGYLGTSITGGSTTTGGNSGNGVVTISYTTVAPAITSAAHVTFTPGQDGTFTVMSTGAPTAALSESGTLPHGVTFVDNGDGTATLSGTPAAGTGGIYTFTIKAANGASPNATQSFTLSVSQSPSITSAASTTFQAGHAGSFTVTSSGAPAAALSESGALPSGVNFVDNGNGTAALSGKPAAASGGTYKFTITAANAVTPNASQSFTLTVQGAPTAVIRTPRTGGIYTLGQSVATTFSCTEGASGTGLASCNDSAGAKTSAGGSSHLETSTAGVHTYTVTATSADGLTGTATVSYRVVAVATIGFAGGTASVSHGRVDVKLACKGGAPGGSCHGELSLTVRERVHKRHSIVTKTVVVASGRYSVPTGHTRTVTLSLTSAGRRFLGSSHHLRVEATATLTGGKAGHRAIVITA